MGLAENIDALLVKFDITADGLARLLDVSPAAVSGWRHGSNIREANIKSLMDHFGLTRDDILSADYGLAAKEHGRVPDSPFPGALPITAGEPAYVPVIGHIHAGAPTEIDNADYILEIPRHVKDNHPNSFGYIVDGDCMDKIYPEGCLVVVDKDLRPQSGSIGAYLIDGYESVLRRVYQGANTLILSPESYNAEHKDLVFTQGDDHIIEGVGTVVWYQASKELS